MSTNGLASDGASGFKTTDAKDASNKQGIALEKPEGRTTGFSHDSDISVSQRAVALATDATLTTLTQALCLKNESGSAGPGEFGTPTGTATGDSNANYNPNHLQSGDPRRTDLRTRPHYSREQCYRELAAWAGQHHE
jgi:hypothetical protein